MDVPEWTTYEELSARARKDEITMRVFYIPGLWRPEGTFIGQREREHVCRSEVAVNLCKYVILMRGHLYFTHDGQFRYWELWGTSSVLSYNSPVVLLARSEYRDPR